MPSARIAPRKLVSRGSRRAASFVIPSDCWRPFFYLLEAAGLNAELVNARDVKNAPSRSRTVRGAV